MLWLLLVGFAPYDGPPPGPAAPHLDTHALPQQLWAAEPATRTFRERWGAWSIRWDERNKTPRALMGGGVLESDAAGLAQSVAELAGVAASDLVPDGRTQQGDRSATRLSQTWRGVPIEGAHIDVFAHKGRVNLVFASLHRVTLHADPHPTERVLPLHMGDRVRYALVTRHEQDDEVYYIDRDGHEVHRWSRRHHLEMLVEERTAGDELIRVPARQVTVEADKASEVTDDAGEHSLGETYSAQLEGPFLQVKVRGSEVLVDEVVDHTLEPGVDLESYSAVSVQHHFHTVRDWLEVTDATNPWLPDLVPATVDKRDGTCNAFYTSGTINFYDEGDGCTALGRISDVIFHEYGHGVHHYGLLGGTFAGDISEGSADYVSATLLESPVVGKDWRGPDSWIRDIEPDKRYPEDLVGEVHADGLIWASFLWNLRAQWSEERGAEDGVRDTDVLFLNTLHYGPTLTDISEAVLAADDDNGDLRDGTPHACELVELLDQHGLGPGPLGMVLTEHEPVADQPTGRVDIPVSWSMWHVTDGCGGFDPDSVRLKYTVDPPNRATMDDLVFEEVLPTQLGDGAYEAVIPATPAGTEVAYYLSWSDAERTEESGTHGNSVAGLYRYWSGDTETWWCDDMEAGWGGWTTGPGTAVVGLNHPEWYSEFDVGPPTATDFGPNAALSGDQIVATDLEGWYEADNTQYLQAASLDLSEAPRSMLRLQTGRWLSVEKSEYDVARIRAVTAQVDELLWQNPYSYDVIDGGWRTQVVDMRHLHDAGPLSLVWTLGTDGGLEYAGWALDDVCISGLADPPGAYADASLAALPIGDTIELRWSDPWVVPLVETVLVRKHSTSPTGPEDGTVLMRVTDPVPGTERVVVDDTAAAFSRWDWHYALFASDAEGHWFTALRPGNIAALVDPVPEQPDTSVTDDDIEPLAGPTVTQVPLDDPGGCGCATGPGVGGGWWALGLLALARRRSVV